MNLKHVMLTFLLMGILFTGFLSIVSLPLSFILGFFIKDLVFRLSLTLIPSIIVSSLLVIFALIYYGTISKKGRVDYWIGLCTWREKLPLIGLNLNENYELLQGEKVLMPRTLCMTSSTLPAISFFWRPMSFIVTSKRIMMGMRLDLILYLRDTFGRMNYWKSDVEEMPEHHPPLRSNFRIDDIQYGEDKEVPFIEVTLAIVETSMAGFLKTDIPASHGKVLGRIGKIRIYHPQAKKIFELFAKAKKQ